MELLRDEDRIRGVKITGGEPFYDVKLLDEVITVLYETFGIDLELSISTNGMWLERLHEIKYLEYIEAIHISRHHYDDSINRGLFGGAAVPNGAKLREIVSSVSFPDIFVFNCMLLKGYIDSREEAHRFLDFSIDVGVPKVGFMACTPINPYAEKHRVLYEDVIRDGDESFLFIGSFRLDRIIKTPTILEKEAIKMPTDFNINKYINTSFRMYNSKTESVELICDNSVMDAIIDRFGEDVQTYANDMQTFRAMVDVSVNHVFFGWVFGFAGKVKIKSPKEVKDQYYIMLEAAK